MELQPIDDFVLKGFQQRFQQQFECPGFYVTTNEEATVAQLAREGTVLTYPYAFLRVSSWAPNTEGYSSNHMARQGLIAVVEDDNLVAHKVRCMAATSEIEIKYVTDKFKSTQQGSVLAFVRRWLMSRRNGALQFNVRYGRLSLGIQVALGESVPFSPRENSPENETSYQVLTTASIKGYVSEPILGQQGIVNQGALLEAEGLSGGTFFPFPNVMKE